MLRWLLLFVVVLGAVSYVERDRIAPYAPAALAPLLRSADDGAGAGTGAGGSRGHGGSGAPAAVTVATAASGSLPVVGETIGTILPVASTVLTSETTAKIASLAVPQGALVKRGDLVVSLDDRAAQAQIGKDNAAIARDQVALAQANRDFQRAAALVKSGAFDAQQGEDARSAAETAAAVLAVDEAALAADQVALDKLRIAAPFDGRLGAFQVSAGALVTPGVPIVTLTQVSPVYAAVTLPEGRLGELRRSLAAGTLAVSLRAAGAGEGAVAGTVSFIDDAVDAASGTVALRAAIDNPDGALLPGQSISATVTAGERDGLVLVPSVAVEPREDGSAVYVVKDDDTVEIRQVEVALRVGDRTGLSSGLQPGERVVTEGQGALSDGARVKPQAAAPATPPDGGGDKAAGDGKAAGEPRADSPVAEAGATP